MESKSTAREWPFFANSARNKMGKIDPATMGITEYNIARGARPRRLAITADDKIYFTDFKGGNLGRLGSHYRRRKNVGFPAVTTQALWHPITTDGMVWYSESGVRPNTIINLIRRPKNSRAPPFLRVAAWYANMRQRPMDGCILLAAA